MAWAQRLQAGYSFSPVCTGQLWQGQQQVVWSLFQAWGLLPASVMGAAPDTSSPLGSQVDHHPPVPIAAIRPQQVASLQFMLSVPGGCCLTHYIRLHGCPLHAPSRHHAAWLPVAAIPSMGAVIVHAAQGLQMLRAESLAAALLPASEGAAHAGFPSAASSQCGVAHWSC